ncbi:MAG: AAA family ATPase [Gemmatimonadaceae bacterium]|nr:AAA family ATPase [Gemmatimonadaceae bacterium]
MASARFRDAVAIARRARDEAPDEQACWRLLLETLLSASDPIAAVAEADALEQQLATDGDAADPQTTAIVRQVRRQTSGGLSGERPRVAPSSSVVLARDLVGREHEFSALLGAWDAVTRTSSGRWVHLTAPAGLGKSRLLHDLAARIRAGRGRVIEVRGAVGERALPYAAAASLAGALAALRGAAGISPASASAILALAPVASAYLSGAPDATSGDEARRRRALAVQELVAAVADEQPVAILLDDVHWCDDASRTLLDLVLPRSRAHAVLVVTAARPSESGSLHLPPDATLPVPPLRGDDVALLLSTSGTLPSTPWAEELPERLAATTGGSPLLIIETVQRCLDTSVLAVHEGTWQCHDDAALRVVLEDGAAIRYRVRQLDADAAFALLVLSVAGTAVPRALLARALYQRAGTGASTTDNAPLDTDVLPAMAVLERRALARVDGDRWRAAHDEIADASIAVASALDVQRAHRALGLALAASGGGGADHDVRALAHLVQGDAPAPAALVERVLRAAAARADRRDPHDVLADVSGASRDTPRVHAMVRALPLRVRWRRRYRAARTALLVVGAMAAGGTAAALWRPAPGNAPVTRLLVQFAGDSMATAAVSLDVADWTTDEALSLRPLEADERMLRNLSLAQTSDISLADGIAFGHAISRGTGGLDIVRLDPDGRVTALTDDPADDVLAFPSPDRQRVYFMSRRWEPVNDRGNVAMLDVASGRVTQLTYATDATETPAAVNADGTRLLYS